MTSKFKVALAAAALSATAITMVPAAHAQVAQGVATANFDAAVKQTNAYKAAMAQIQTAYKAQIDQFNTRNQILQSELQTLALKYQADAKANPNNPALKAQEAAFQAKQAASNEELQRLGTPIARAQAFVEEQFDGKFDTAVRSAMKRKNIGMILAPNAILAIAPGNDLTPDITADLNATVPSVSIAVPANWQPGQRGAAPAPGAAPVAAPRPATPAPAPTPAPRPQGR